MSSTVARVAGSFRDPSGFVYHRDGTLYRQIQPPYAETYAKLKQSGFLAQLEQARLLVSAPEDALSLAAAPGAVAVLRPEPVPFVSYPYEWSFGMLKDAAILTLEIQKRSIESGFTLKDASSFNVQFVDGQPIFIDTLSFDPYIAGEPWIAYGQFCRHFLAPLALMAKVDVRLGELLSQNLDGIPLDLAARLLPVTTRWSPGLLAHLHLHAKAGSGNPDGASRPASSFSRDAMLGLIGSLRKTVESLSWAPVGTEWASYYSDTNYTQVADGAKISVVSSWLHGFAESGQTCWDLGANNGRYSQLAAEAGLFTIAADVDPAAVEQAYRYVASTRARIHPLLVDLRNPAPSCGWAQEERRSIFERGPADVAMALAIVHHLAIGNNVPLADVWRVLLRCGRSLIVEWVPKSDSQVQRMMHARKDVFGDYCQESFEASLPSTHRIAEKSPLPESGRVLYKVVPA